MELGELINNPNIDIKKSKGSKLTQVAGFDELDGDYFVVDVDNTPAKALIYQNEHNETALVCVGKVGLWMSSVAYEFEQTLNQGETLFHSFKNNCSEEILNQAVEHGFSLVSTSSGMLELRKQLDDGFISITSTVWTDMEDQSSLSANGEQWMVSRFENHSVNSGFSAEDLGYVSIMEETTLQNSLELSEILEEFDMNYCDDEEVVFENWEHFKSYNNQLTFTA